MDKSKKRKGRRVEGAEGQRENRRKWGRARVIALGILSAVCRFSSGTEAASEPPTLPLAEALREAVDYNPAVVRLRLEGAKLEQRLAATRTRRLPQFRFDLFASQQLRDVDFLFRQGLFGTFPGIGPVPPVDTTEVTGKVPTAIINAAIIQPITQQHAIGLNVRQLELEIKANEQKLRAERQRVVADVKAAYYGVLLTQSGLTAARKGIELYQELDRVTKEHVVQKVALRSDRLEVETRLARAEYEALVLEDRLATQKQKLNLLSGRPVDRPFSVTPVGDPESDEVTLERLRQLALEQRPEIHEARLRTEQAEIDKRIKRAERIPDLSLSMSYLSPFNFSELLPTHITGVGLILRWEVYDWGRRKREIAEKGFTVEQARSGLEEARSQVMIDVEAKYRKLQQARQLLRIARLVGDRAGENLRVVSNRYKQEFSLLKDVLQAQTELEQSRLEYDQALLSFWTARAELEKALGEEE